MGLSAMNDELHARLWLARQRWFSLKDQDTRAHRHRHDCSGTSPRLKRPVRRLALWKRTDGAPKSSSMECYTSLVESLRILLLSILAAITYGVVHDQVTARVCVEYFTIGHPPLFPTQSPTLLGLGWGILATWWMGLLLGIPLALCARAGSAPSLGARDLLKPVGILLVTMALLALVAGVVGYKAAKAGWFVLPPGASERLPEARHAVFIADLFAHLASYAAGTFGGLALCAWTVIRRRRVASDPLRTP